MLGMGVHTEKPSHQQFVIFIALTVKVRGKRNIFKDFRGVLHADAYSGYDQLYQNQNNPEAEITEAGCWSHTAAGIYSLIETAKMNNINPHLYLQKVLATIQDYNHKKIVGLLPWNIMALLAK